jgi:hypothetical protein
MLEVVVDVDDDDGDEAARIRCVSMFFRRRRWRDLPLMLEVVDDVDDDGDDSGVSL